MFVDILLVYFGLLGEGGKEFVQDLGSNSATLMVLVGFCYP